MTPNAKALADATDAVNIAETTYVETKANANATAKAKTDADAAYAANAKVKADAAYRKAKADLAHDVARFNLARARSVFANLTRDSLATEFTIAEYEG